MREDCSRWGLTINDLLSNCSHTNDTVDLFSSSLETNAWDEILSLTFSLDASTGGWPDILSREPEKIFDQMRKWLMSSFETPKWREGGLSIDFGFSLTTIRVIEKKRSFILTRFDDLSKRTIHKTIPSVRDDWNAYARTTTSPFIEIHKNAELPRRSPRLSSGQNQNPTHAHNRNTFYIIHRLIEVRKVSAHVINETCAVRARND